MKKTTLSIAVLALLGSSAQATKLKANEKTHQCAHQDEDHWEDAIESEDHEEEYHAEEYHAEELTSDHEDHEEHEEEVDTPEPALEVKDDGLTILNAEPEGVELLNKDGD